MSPKENRPIGYEDRSVICAEVPASGADARVQLKRIQDYAVYYGAHYKTLVDELSNYGLVIIDPGTIPDVVERAQLRSNKTLVVAYLSVGEVRLDSPLLSEVPEDWLVGEVTPWRSRYVDVRQPGWRTLMQREAENLLGSEKFDGLFLDTVDTIDALAHLDNVDTGMVQLIDGLRAQFPNAVIVQNRGFKIVDRTLPSIDAVMYEDLTTNYNPPPLEAPPSQEDSGLYETIEPDQALVDQLKDRQRSDELVVLALDYAKADHSAASREIAKHAIEYAREQGFIPFVSVGLLDKLVTYEF